jgi:hypothetical protein
MSDFTKSKLIQFLDMAMSKGLVNTNTGGAWKAAVNKILADLSDDDEVHQLDVHDAVIRYNNRFPGDLTPESLKKYEQRASMAIEQFVSWKTDPMNYRSPSRGIKSALNGKDEGKAKKKSPATAVNLVQPAAANASTTFHTATLPMVKPADPGLQIPFPLRPDFVAQVHIPRNLSVEEAKRLSVFIQALGHDAPVSSGSEDGKAQG